MSKAMAPRETASVALRRSERNCPVLEKMFLMTDVGVDDDDDS